MKLDFNKLRGQRHALELQAMAAGQYAQTRLFGMFCDYAEECAQIAADATQHQIAAEVERQLDHIEINSTIDPRSIQKLKEALESITIST